MPKHVAFTDEFNKSLFCLTTIHILIPMSQHKGINSIKIIKVKVVP